MLLGEILAQIPGSNPAGSPEVPILGISYDSRTLKEGYLFVAIKGEKTDGNRYIGEAIARGAVALASEEPVPPHPGISVLRVPDARKFLAQVSQVFFRHPANSLELVGITGTNGKTTVSYLIESIFRRAGFKSCLAGTTGMRIGDKLSPSLHTTPEAPDLLFFLRRAVSEGCTHGVLEVSSHSLAARRIFGTRFAVAVFTNLTPEHLDFHHDMEAYYQAKRLLFMPEGENEVRLGVINTDDSWGRRLASQVHCPVISFGLSPKAGVRALGFEARLDGTEILISTPGGELKIGARLIGRPNVYNILAAAAACLGMGIDLEGIRGGVEAMELIPGRLESIDCGQPFKVLVDYAHTPDALEKVIETLSEIPHRRIIVVFGCGGDRDRSKRPAMGEIAGRMSDFVIATSDNPRTEDPERILEEIEPGLRSGRAPYRLVVDRREAITAALNRADVDDVVLIAGKGHENYQILGGEYRPFDDRIVAREILTQMANLRGSRN